MNKKILLITGGTGGHVIPAINFGNYLLEKKIDCKIILDKRGQKYIHNFNGKIHIIKSSNFNGNLLLKVKGSINFLIGFIQSFLIILFFKPNIAISFGSYASFFPMLSCVLLKHFLKIKIYIHEQNSILGRTNKLFLIFLRKLFLNFNIKSKINNRFKKITFVVGSPQKNIVKLKSKINTNINHNFTILIYGGSQGSEYVSNFGLDLIKIIESEKIINANFIIQCPNNLIKKFQKKLEKVESRIILKEFFDNIEEILQNTSLAISRAGAGSICDLINYNIPSVLIPLPSAKDNHQFHNALIMRNNGTAILIDEKRNELNKAKNYIYEIYNDNSNFKLKNEKFNNPKNKNSNELIYNLIKDEK